MSERVTGRISVNVRGFGFLTFGTEEGGFEGEAAGLDEGRAAFVAPPDLNPFLAGDVVTAEITDSGGGRLAAKNLVLVERPTLQLLGELVEHKGRPYLAVEPTVSNTDWPIDAGDFDLPPLGEFLVCAVGTRQVVPLRVVPRPQVDLERVLVRHDIRSEFPPSCSIDPKRLPPFSAEGRRDLRGLVTVTIDAPTSMDLDDALSIYPADPDGGLRLLVSIADVDALVPKGSPLDEEARLRGTSTYLAGAVIPMLPRELSEDRLSLLPGEDRPALTAEIRIDPEGEVTAVDLYTSLVRSTMRLDYDTVAAFLDRNAAEIPKEVLPTLRWLRTAAARIGAVRAARGGVRLLREEAYVTVDRVTQEPTAIDARLSTSAHALVERLMVATNEAVGRWLIDRGLPGLFRVHEAPDADRTRQLEEVAHNFGFELGLGGRLAPRGLAALEAQFEGTSVAPAMREVLSRTLGPARYDPRPGLHYGLAAPVYLHFTSPIRRYPDLVVHRVVKRFLEGRRDQRAGDPELAPLAEHLNERMYRSAKAERERLWMMAARLFSTRIGERYKGNIVGKKPFGLVVQLDGTGVTGTIANEALPDEPFEIGQELEVEVAGTDELLGRIELRLKTS